MGTAMQVDELGIKFVFVRKNEKKIIAGERQCRRSSDSQSETKT